LIIEAKDDILTANLLPKKYTLTANREEFPLNREKALIEASIQGDAEAFRELIEPYQPTIFNLALRFMADYNEALDLSQDVLLKIYLKLKTFHHKSSLLTWIYRLTINTARNKYHWWKRRKKDRTFSLDIISDIASKNDNGSPEDILLKRELREKIQEGINRLRFPYKNVLILRDIELLSYEEISQILQISQGTVKSRLSRARNILKDYLKTYF
jgi:RNA polymerase sigma-70 factor (ECF subfamily)